MGSGKRRDYKSPKRRREDGEDDGDEFQGRGRGKWESNCRGRGSR